MSQRLITKLIQSLIEDLIQISVFSLPYTESSIREIMRYETLPPSGLPHLTMEDTNIMGYDIPKVNLNKYSGHQTTQGFIV